LNIGTTSEEQMRELLSEDPVVAEKREKLRQSGSVVVDSSQTD
jgi:hypothetical protein